MPDLSRDLRRQLESVIRQARDAAELGAAEALRRLGVFESRRPERLDDATNDTRKRLRAHAKSLGDSLTEPDGDPLPRLVEAAAYVQWHRLLFARFLLERDLLRDDLGVVSLADCREEAGAGGDEWAVAAAHTARMLPGVFPADDPVEALTLAPEHAKALRDHLMRLDAAIFQADDSLGWTYQFWRAAEKERVNASGVKIGAAELPAVTQLFTEPYMVRFLLHNTLGAWWAGKVLAERPELAHEAADEAALRAASALPEYSWDLLRFVREDRCWRPAAGAFAGWPKTAAELTVLDPCCGSGHFLTEALTPLAALRAYTENSPLSEAVVNVLSSNLAGLEIDGRCVQIAAFALALTSWRIGGKSLKLPSISVAWVGGAPPLPRSEFAALGNGDVELARALDAIHGLLTQAPLLGSLIEPVGGDLVDARRVAKIEQRMHSLLAKMRNSEPDRVEGALAACGIADAASILARTFTLQLTNVPFLGRGRQDARLATYLSTHFDKAKADLGVAMLVRMSQLAAPNGTIAAVTPQNWFFSSIFKKFREGFLSTSTINLAVPLGEHGFDSPAAAGAFAALIAFSTARPIPTSSIAVIDASDGPDPISKAQIAATGAVDVVQQSDLRSVPDSRIGTNATPGKQLLSHYATSLKGVATGDLSRFIFRFWEIDRHTPRWEYLQEPATDQSDYTARSAIILWDGDDGPLRSFVEERLGENGAAAWLRGGPAWGKSGVAVAQMRSLPATLYTGEIFDESTGVIIPNVEENLAAIWEFVCSPGYVEEVRRIDRSLKVPTLTLLKVPFDLTHWQQVAAEKYPNGLPEPYSDDPTQWLFHGHARHAVAGTQLHVALARLAGYRWPAETDTAMRLSAEARALIAQSATLPPADADGLLGLPPVLGERPLADRLRAFCATAWGDAWTAGTEAELVTAACERFKDKPPGQRTLDAWLRTHAARQHAKLFHDRPFLWWITDGRADGFTAVVHYHRLDKTNLERLTYTVLGDWLARIGEDPRAEAARVLQAKLARILEGESPYDIFVRWKPLHAQPLGWDHDLDDGVRQNIRPFLEAGVLSYAPDILKAVDRGKDMPSAPWFHEFNGGRRNDHHTKLEEKRAAREAAAADRQRGYNWPAQTSAPTIDPANAASILRPMIRDLLETGQGGTGEWMQAGGTASWIQSRAALVRRVLDPEGGPTGPEARAANMLLQWMGPRLFAAKRLPVAVRPPNAVSSLPLARAEELFAALRIAADVSGTNPGSMVTSVGNRLELLPRERRVALGTTNRDGKQRPLLLFTEANESALKRASADGVPARVVGQAVSQGDTFGAPTVPLDEHRPGRSVAHEAGRAGSLGAYVNWDDPATGRRLTGFLSAGHVIARMGNAHKGDHIHSPGFPDADNNIRHRYGLLEDARRLNHADDHMAADAYVNECDIALARLHPNRPATNTVPGPESGGPPVRIVRAMTESELRAFDGDMFMIGRATPHARGRVYGYEFNQIVFQMSDGRDYIFAKTAVVESFDLQVPFSRSGDSGALVYAFVSGDWVAVGFVIGAVDRLTYISPAERCLNTMQVQLLGA